MMNWMVIGKMFLMMDPLKWFDTLYISREVLLYLTLWIETQLVGFIKEAPIWN